MCGAIEEVIPPCGTIPPILFLVCIAECVLCVCVCDAMSRSFIVTGSIRWMPSLVPREGVREGEGGADLFFQVCCLFELIWGGRCTLHKKVCVYVCVCF